jgi:hypothetical protein
LKIASFDGKSVGELVGLPCSGTVMTAAVFFGLWPANVIVQHKAKMVRRTILLRFITLIENIQCK